METINNKVNRIENAKDEEKVYSLPTGSSVPQPSAQKQAKQTSKQTQSISSPPQRPPLPPGPTPQPRRKPKSSFLQKPKLLYLGDSIAYNIATKHIEDKTGSRIMEKKAKSSAWVWDKRARWPNSNVKEVTEEALEEAPMEDKFEHVVISAQTVDITYLKSSQTTRQHRRIQAGSLYIMQKHYDNCTKCTHQTP